ncbi:hypothetical protein C0J52_19021 [Blattella germanica]|nr:hypothetical protein C0J52_19021 [Blattella germanica]
MHLNQFGSSHETMNANAFLWAVVCKQHLQVTSTGHGSIFAALLVVSVKMSSRGMRLRPLTCSEYFKIIKNAEEHGNRASARKFDLSTSNSQHSIIVSNNANVNLITSESV